MADNINIKDSGGTVIPVATDEVSTLNGATVSAVDVQRVKTGYGPDGSYRDVDDTHPLPVSTKTTGTYGYAAGSAAANIDVPTGARITRVSVLAGATVAGSVTILSGQTIPIPAGSAFDEQISGDALATSSTNEVVVGGTVQAYYVAWAV